MAETSITTDGSKPAPPASALKWRRSLIRIISSPASLVMLLAIGYLVATTWQPALRWLVLDADWNGTTYKDCDSGGACWVFLRVHMGQFLFGFYPAEERWRVLFGFGVPMIAAAFLFLPNVPYRNVLAYALVLLGPVFALAIFAGGFADLSFVPATQWGGLMVTLVVGFIGILLSVPLGTLLALGRQSSMPLMRALCVIYIEVWRGVPLLGVLFMVTLLMPLTLPPEIVISRFAAVMIGVVLYAAAFIAEILRGGLQGIDRLQTEASDALGFTYWRRMQFIILPQAFRKVLPALVNTFINLFKSSTLVLVVGVFDLLGIVQNAAHNADWSGYYMEGYIFVAALFWIICHSISRYSAHLERKLDRTGRRGALDE
jgi:general L-amino acid transport system permease protein